MRIRGKRTILLLVVLVVLGAAGMALAAFNGDPTPDEILTRVVETLHAAEDGHAVLRIEADTPDKDGRVRVEVWAQFPEESAPDAHTKFRAEVLEADEAKLEGGVAVSDGEQVWFYLPARNTVWTGSVDELHRRGGDHEKPPFDSPEALVEWLGEVSEVTLAGSEQVSGEAAYTLDFVPRSDALPEASAAGVVGTMWVDSARWVPLQATVDAGANGQARVTAERAELNVGVADERFTFEIPEGAEVVQLEDRVPQHLTLDEARAAVDFELLMPSETEAALVDVLKVRDTIVLRYESALGPFAVSQGTDERAIETPDAAGESVSVRGTTGTLFTDETGARTLLTWTEDGRTFTVSGSIDADTARAIAESLQ